MDFPMGNMRTFSIQRPDPQNRPMWGCILTAKWASIVNAIIISSSVGYGFSILTLVINALMEGKPPEVGWGRKKHDVLTCHENETCHYYKTCHIKSPGLQVRLFGIHQCESTTLWFLFIWGWLYWIKLYSDVGLELDMNYLRSYTCIEYVVGTRGWWIRLSDHNGSLWVRCK